ncbi:SET and MYND domain-containing protein 4-like [Anthonomus grandis grandis]|uniref:SET and MYND domain-containing protein 4-like n=1 Tax=Anthonomus grandis grandis TaxID=2921223 RepID=UPI0021663ABD|nr:SET and MYND domain-containing protein 4-like [Anthonomus grandis grandis]XP_050304511.1 SET and MYND domain-containing protein 4-like [Anthonomus grandis grandis]
MISPGEIEDPQITSEQLLSLKSDIRIVNMLEELAHKHCPSQYRDIEGGGKIAKNKEKALGFREDGRKMLRQKNHFKALLAFTQCIANAEDKSELLGLGYGGRAEVLFEKGYFRECLQDIDRALQNNYPKDLVEKLLEKQTEAQSNQSSQPLKKYHEETPSLSHPNAKIPSASDSVEIQNDGYGGRQVVATKPIEAGEIVVVERPYTVAVGTKPSQRYLHCHECLERCYNLIPCPNCRTALYCSEKCRDTAKEWYHSYECDLCQFDFNELLNVKTVLKGLRELTGVGANGHQQFDGTVYKSDRYEEIQVLQTNKEKRSVRDLFEAANEACIIHHFLAKYSDFFAKSHVTEERLKELLFHHYFNTTLNKISVEKTKKNSIDTEFHEVGEGVYAFASLLNHHCYGNVTTTFYGATLVLRAAKNIKTGEPLYLTYKNYNFAEYPKLVRSHQLFKYYQFTCSCEACENNWPIFDCLNPGDIEKYQQLAEQIKATLKDPNGDIDGLLLLVTNQVKKFSNAEPTKVDVNVKRIFCDLLKFYGNKISDF